MSSRKKRQLGAKAHAHGVSFCVWAPFAEAVAVAGSFNDWQPAPMESIGDGYWFVDVKNALAGQEYKYAITVNGQLQYKNDPRSLQLTTSSGGTSVIVDGDYDWGSVEFIPPPPNRQVLYELHIGTFYRSDPAMSGTFDDAIQKLDYLKDLGVNMIELMPVSSMSSDRGWGYAADYIYAIESLYGGRRGLMDFVKAAHQKGLGVVLDVVYNHFGPDPAGLDLWRFDGWSENDKGGIYFYNDDRAKTPWGDTRPDFGRAEVQEYILENVAMWMADCRIDGLRVDSTIYIRNIHGHNDDPPGDIPEGWQLLQRLTQLARKINPNALLIAEDVGANDYLTKPVSAGGAGFDAQWELSFPEVMRSVLSASEDKQRNLSGICDLLGKSFNDDPFQRVIYSDSHDSAANGSVRLNELISPGNPSSVYARKRMLMAAALVLSAPGIPMLFQGQEFMEGGKFNDWHGLDWEKADRNQGIILAHKHLIALRTNQYGDTAGLCGRSLNILHTDWDNNVLAFHRWDKGGAGDDTIIIINFNNRAYNLYRLGFPLNGKWRVRFNSSWSGYSPEFKDLPLDEINVTDNSATIKLASYSVLILSQDK